jgi:agmatine deiminase
MHKQRTSAANRTPAQPERTVRIALIQSRVSESPAANVAKTSRTIRKAAEGGAKVICLQELFQTRYFPVAERADARHLAESIPGTTTAALAGLAKELGVVIVVPIYESDRGRFFNSAAVIDADGSIAGTYRKIHIPHDPYFYEQSYFESGDLGYRIFRTRHLTFSVLICYDQWFPEAARAAALLGAEVIFYPTAIGHLKNDPIPASEWLDAWTTIQRGHAIANHVHVAAVNRAGHEEPVTFFGGSFVCDAFGRTLARAVRGEEILFADIDVSQNARMREGWRFTKNRHPESYTPLTEETAPETPKRLGYAMPAEWAPHAATWLAWPEDPATYPGRLEKARAQYIAVVAALHRFETVHLAVKDAATRGRVRSLLAAEGVDLRRVQLHVWDYADVWIRDYGPTFVVDRARGRMAVIQWRFNAWGGKYPTLLKDGQAPYFISEYLGLDLFRPGIVLEGGAIDVNGRGTILATEQCVLNANRNPGLLRRQMERYFDDYLGARHVIWLKKGLIDDDTDGHIDNLARFVDPRTVVCSWEDDPADENHAVLRENHARLRRSKDQDGRPLNVVKLPMPPAKRVRLRGKTQRLSSSYANFYIANGVVLVPAYDRERDAVAHGILKGLFPGRTLVPIDCRDLIYGAGALHCITQQQPSVAEP